jgi:hypothetical protein
MLPNLVIAGAPKCGTTSLFNWLADHPDVGSPEKKELFYLLDKDFWIIDKKFNYHTHGLEGYKTYFDHCYNKKIVMEASTPYIYQNTSREVLKTFHSKPKIVFVLREPSQRLFSNYKYFYNNKATQKTELTFTQYVHRVMNKEVSGGNQQVTDAFNHGCYITYIRQWLNDLGAENIRIVFFENLISDPLAEIKNLSSWLGIDQGFYSNYVFKADNASFELKSFQFHKWSRYLAETIPKSAFRQTLKTMYRTLNTKKPTKKTDHDLKTLNMLKDAYRSFNQDLFTLLNIDSVW